MDPASALPALLATAWLLPLVSFVLIVLFGKFMGKAGVMAGYVATGAIVSACVLSMIALFVVWLPSHPLADPHEHHEGEVHDADHDAAAGAPIGSIARAQSPDDHGHDGDHDDAAEHSHDEGHGHDHVIVPPHHNGDWYSLGQFGKLNITIGYYIDSLTVAMFCMVTLIASCIHFYAMGYMHDELHDFVDHEVTLDDGEHLHRPGRYYRFFQYLSLFCFSMLGIVIAGNIAMVFVFWELVGICSYFLIGFYIERHSASTAANKAFIVNRVGDFGMIIGLMALWGSLGTFSFGDYKDSAGHTQPGIYSQVRSPENNYRLETPEGMVLADTGNKFEQIRRDHADRPEDAESEIASQTSIMRDDGKGYWLLVIAGLGIFCGCVGKSAQFPLQVWLPDAMEGPTPVSALVHSATMVAAGVYLVGRFFPVFAPEVLLTIAYIGCITLFVAATIAITATDIKRVLAYSTVSQLGYMMLALGVGGWLAGMMHLFTHAFFKSLLFMCSGSVIHAVHSNEMTEMGGLRKKMPWTAYTMLIGCLAIIGAGIPFVIGFSGYYSKDAILEQAMLFGQYNGVHGILFFAAAGGAAITAFYMFRLWYMTFAGKPRNQDRYDHAHESPKVMYVPLVVLSVFAIGVAWSIPGSNLSLSNLLEQARPAGTLAEQPPGMLLHDLVVPNEHDSHAAEIKVPATLVAFSTAMGGLLLATVIYCWRILNPDEVRQQFRGLHRFLLNKWWFDELYNATFVWGTHILSKLVAWIDKNVIDGVVHASAFIVRWISTNIVDRVLDRIAVDGLINAVAYKTWDLGLSLRNIQTGKLRQYVMFIVVGTVAMFVLISFFWSYAVAN